MRLPIYRITVLMLSQGNMRDVSTPFTGGQINTASNAKYQHVSRIVATDRIQ